MNGKGTQIRTETVRFGDERSTVKLSQYFRAMLFHLLGQNAVQ